MKNIIDLTDKKILVTGASSGIGRATAVLLSEVGARVVLAARREEGIKETLSLMKERELHHYYAIDLTRFEQIGSMIADSVNRDEKKFDGLVHCAGIAPNYPIQTLSYEKLDTLMRVHCYAYIELIKQLSKRKYRAQTSSMVGISSVAAVRGKKSQAAYATAKGAMDSATVVLATELAGRGIRVNTIRPGWVKTSMAKAHCINQDIQIEELDKVQLLGIAEPEDIANMAAFLLSPASQKITGQHVMVDGGGFI